VVLNEPLVQHPGFDHMTAYLIIDIPPLHLLTADYSSGLVLYPVFYPLSTVDETPASHLSLPDG